MRVNILCGIRRPRLLLKVMEIADPAAQALAQIALERCPHRSHID